MIRNIYETIVPNKIKSFLYLRRLGPFNFEREVIKVYSHPRSGTHFLEAFLAENFYSKKDLKTQNVEWGHWANRKSRTNGNPYGKLFGNHYFPEKWAKAYNFPMIYIYRDGRDVAHSIWKTPNFLHPKYENITFSDFLKIKLDWKGTPGVRHEPEQNIAQHWYSHVKDWHNVENKNLLLISYEDLKANPTMIYDIILKKFFPLKHILKKLGLFNPKVIEITKPTGLKPNKAIANGWKAVFEEDDTMFFLSHIESDAYLIKNDNSNN